MTAQTLQDRLRAVDPDESFPFGTENETITTCNQAADAIDTLRAEVARLRLALSEFAQFASKDGLGASVPFGQSKLHKARAALAHGEADQ